MVFSNPKILDLGDPEPRFEVLWGVVGTFGTSRGATWGYFGWSIDAPKKWSKKGHAADCLELGGRALKNYQMVGSTAH